LALKPDHVSAYSLTIEEKTVFGRWASKGKLIPVSDDQSAEHLTILVNLLDEAGFEHYEVSNFAMPGYISRHNSNYWKNKKYLGVGPSAHSFDLLTRQFNVANNAAYLRSISDGIIPFELENLSTADRTNDYILTGLRTKWGISVRRLKEEFDDDLFARRGSYVMSLTSSGRAEYNGDTLTLTPEGKMLADKIAMDLFVVKSD
jgi:oxygen-independent coproporphyrinogen-3 oxidase